MKMIDGKLHRYAYLLVYGCQMNQSDAERMMGQLRTIGYERTESMEEADLILINTCCVRETAEDRVYGKIGEIKRLKRENPELIFGITGCMAQKEGDALIKRAPHIDFVLGTNKVHELTHVVQEIQAEHGHVVDVQLGETELPDDVPVARAGSLSAWVPIMYGCNNFCTYCIVPYTRGRERSREPESILNELRDLQNKGFKEVILLGQNVNSYLFKPADGGEPVDMAALLALVAEAAPEMRVRFTTSNPEDLSDEIIATMASHANICNHIHLPVQSGSNKILKLMNRKYTREWYLDRIAKIREAMPDCGISSDMFTGFHNETEEDFEETLSLMREVGFDSSFMFKYSERPGTFAAKHLPDNVSEEVKIDRLNRMIALQNELSLCSNRNDVGKTFEVLVEGYSKRSKDDMFGRTQQNKVIVFPAGDTKVGDRVMCVVEKATSATLIGHRV